MNRMIINSFIWNLPLLRIIVILCWKYWKRQKATNLGLLDVLDWMQKNTKIYMKSVFCKILVTARFVEFVLGSFSGFNIEIGYSNFTFCGTWTPSFFQFTWKMSKFQQNKHTSGSLMAKFQNLLIKYVHIITYVQKSFTPHKSLAHFLRSCVIYVLLEIIAKYGFLSTKWLTCSLYCWRCLWTK